MRPVNISITLPHGHTTKVIITTNKNYSSEPTKKISGLAPRNHRRRSQLLPGRTFDKNPTFLSSLSSQRHLSTVTRIDLSWDLSFLLIEAFENGLFLCFSSSSSSLYRRAFTSAPKFGSKPTFFFSFFFFYSLDLLIRRSNKISRTFFIALPLWIIWAFSSSVFILCKRVLSFYFPRENLKVSKAVSTRCLATFTFFWPIYVWLPPRCVAFVFIKFF